MLSNTDDRKPRLKAVAHEASGRLFTGISDAAATSETRKTAPLNARRATFQSGAAMAAVAIRAAHTAMPNQGASCPPSGAALAAMFAAMAETSTTATIATRRHRIGWPERSW